MCQRLIIPQRLSILRRQFSFRAKCTMVSRSFIVRCGKILRTVWECGVDQLYAADAGRIDWIILIPLIPTRAQPTQIDAKKPLNRARSSQTIWPAAAHRALLYLHLFLHPCSTYPGMNVVASWYVYPSYTYKSVNFIVSCAYVARLPPPRRTGLNSLGCCNLFLNNYPRPYRLIIVIDGPPNRLPRHFLWFQLRIMSGFGSIVRLDIVNLLSLILMNP